MRSNMPSRSRISTQFIGMARITRPLVSIAAPLYTFLGVYLGSDLSAVFSFRSLRASLVVGLIVSFTFALNDYHDVASDLLNHPKRPIPSGQLSPRLAGFLAVLLALAALSVALTLGWLLFAIAVLNSILSVLYSYYFKNTVLIGNGVTGLLNASVVVYGGLVAGNLTIVIWIFSLLCFLFTFAQEILFTVGDQEGDAMLGLHTTATHFGIKAALYLFQFLVFTIVVIIIVCWLSGWVPARFVYTLVPFSLVPLVGTVILLRRNATAENIHLAIRLIQVVRLLSIFPGVMLK